MSSGLYHERQQLALCGVHAVNNLLQTQRFSKSEFDETCLILSDSSLFNPHRSFWRTGNYDVNVVCTLLQQEGLSVTWHDERVEIQTQELNDVLGVLWNVPSASLIGKIFRGRHWIAILRQGTEWVNLDSNKHEPEPVGTTAECIQLLASMEDTHVLLVSKAAVT